MSAWPLSEARTFKRLYPALENPNVYAYGAVYEDRLVGGLVGEVIRDYWVDVMVGIDHVTYVEPEHRGRLLGWRLMRKFETWAKERGAKVMRPVMYADCNRSEINKLLELLDYEPAGGVYIKEVA